MAKGWEGASEERVSPSDQGGSKDVTFKQSKLNIGGKFGGVGKDSRPDVVNKPAQMGQGNIKEINPGVTSFKGKKVI